MRFDLGLLLFDRALELWGKFDRRSPLPSAASFDFLYDTGPFFRPEAFGLDLPEVAFPFDVKFPR